MSVISYWPIPAPQSCTERCRAGCCDDEAWRKKTRCALACRELSSAANSIPIRLGPFFRYQVYEGRGKTSKGSFIGRGGYFSGTDCAQNRGVWSRGIRRSSAYVGETNMNAKTEPVSERQKLAPILRHPDAIHCGRDIAGDLLAAEQREWLVTNGIGGVSSRTGGGKLTRRHHRLLFSGPHPPPAPPPLRAPPHEAAPHRREAPPPSAESG